MNHPSQVQEYSARCGLRCANNNVEVAQQIAEAKYRTLVGRDIVYRERLNIRHIIEELQTLSPSKTNTSTNTVACAH